MKKMRENGEKTAKNIVCPISLGPIPILMSPF